MTVDLATKTAFLGTPGVLGQTVERVETHMSWVFLTETRAFKLKKPVRLPYLDYSSLERRRQSCEQELRLGRRLAANVYEHVAPLVLTAGGLVVGGDGEIVDWLVVMRRLPADRMLPQMLARGAATPSDADAVGDLLADFYASATRAPWTGADYRHRLRNLVVTVAGELVSRGAARSQVTSLTHAQLTMIEREPATLDARIAAGRVVDAHGDLRPEHVCLEPPPLVIDPLEFDDDLRTLDAVSELAFFALECHRLGASWFGERVLARYAERAGDRAPASVILLHRSQHALTRALIALRHLDDAPPDAHARWRAKADDYLARAEPASAPP